MSCLTDVNSQRDPLCSPRKQGFTLECKPCDWLNWPAFHTLHVVVFHICPKLIICSPLKKKTKKKKKKKHFNSTRSRRNFSYQIYCYWPIFHYTNSKLKLVRKRSKRWDLLGWFPTTDIPELSRAALQAVDPHSVPSWWKRRVSFLQLLCGQFSFRVGGGEWDGDGRGTTRTADGTETECFLSTACFIQAVTFIL